LKKALRQTADASPQQLERLQRSLWILSLFKNWTLNLKMTNIPSSYLRGHGFESQPRDIQTEMFVVCSVPPCKCAGNTLILSMTASFHGLCDSSSTFILLFDTICTVQLKKRVKWQNNHVIYQSSFKINFIRK
jgi:hypothetical protein